MNFEKHYFTEEQIDEVLGLNWLAGHWKDFDPRNANNFLRKIVGSAKRKIQPQQYETYELSQAGFQNLFGKLTADYNNPNNKRKKFFVKDLFAGVFKDENAPEAFEEFEEIDSTAVFRLNNGGAVILYNVTDTEGDERYYVGIDGSGQKYFSAPFKKGGLGMIFKTWLAAQKSGRQTWNLSNIAKGDLKKKKTKSSLPHRFEIAKSDFTKMAPDEGTQPQEFRLAASNQSFNLFDLFNEEMVSEETKYVFKNKDGKWIIASSSKNSPQEMDYNDKHTYVAVKTDEPVGSKKKVKELEKDDELQKEIDQFIKSKNPDKKPEKEDSNKIDPKQVGELAVDLHDELDGSPSKIKSTKTVQYGWRYLLKNGGVIFVYERKDGKYMIAYDDKAKKIVEDKNLVNKYGLEKAVSPE